MAIKLVFDEKKPNKNYEKLLLEQLETERLTTIRSKKELKKAIVTLVEITKIQLLNKAWETS